MNERLQFASAYPEAALPLTTTSSPDSFISQELRRRSQQNSGTFVEVVDRRLLQPELS